MHGNNFSRVLFQSLECKDSLSHPRTRIEPRQRSARFRSPCSSSLSGNKGHTQTEWVSEWVSGWAVNGLYFLHGLHLLVGDLCLRSSKVVRDPKKSQCTWPLSVWTPNVEWDRGEVDEMYFVEGQRRKESTITRPNPIEGRPRLASNVVLSSSASRCASCHLLRTYVRAWMQGVVSKPSLPEVYVACRLQSTDWGRTKDELRPDERTDGRRATEWVRSAEARYVRLFVRKRGSWSWPCQHWLVCVKLRIHFRMMKRPSDDSTREFTGLRTCNGNSTEYYYVTWDD